MKRRAMQESEPKYQECIVCGGNEFQDHMKLKDYFLSQEAFSLSKCIDCGLLYTLPRPDMESIKAYYNSEEYTSHNTNQYTLINLLYKQARKIALNRKLEMIKKYLKSGKILDIGCGTGEFLAHCRKNGWDVVGIEPNENARERAITDYGLNIKDSHEFPEISNASFDAITMWHALEHMENPVEQLRLNHQLLKPEGLLVIALPNYESWDANHYGNYWAAYDVPRHLFHFSRESIKRLSEKAGLRIIETLPLKLDAYYISLLSEKYSNGKMNFIRASINGWLSNNAAKKGEFGYSSWVYLMRKK